MISLCTVVDKIHWPYFSYFAKSLTSRAESISNVFVCCITEKPTDEVRVERFKGIEFTYFYHFVPKIAHRISYKHSLGLHACMKRVNTPYIMLSDCDIVFQMQGFDKFMLQTMTDNNLQIVGIEMYKMSCPKMSCPKWRPYMPCYGKYPSIHNCLLKTDNLPDPSIFAGKLKYTRTSLIGINARKGALIEENHYLVCGAIPDYKQYYTHPRGHFDTGCNLIVWSKITNGNWLSFGPGFGYVSTKHYTANCDVKIPSSKRDSLMFHHGGACNPIDTFLAAYKKEFLITVPTV